MSYSTEHRAKILGYMRDNIESQFTVSQLIEALAPLGVGESTVYRQLRLLCSEGQIRRFVCGRRVYYQASRDEKCSHHIHLKCTVCGKLIHLSGFVSEFMVSQVAASHRFAIDESATLLYGRCRKCN